MANPELIEYAKNQMNAGSSANYIRTVLIKQGWGERDVDDALGIAQTEAGPAATGAAPAAEAATAKLATKGEKNRFLAIAGILTGIFFVITGGITIYMLLTIGGMITTMEAALGAAGLITGMISGQMILGWVLGIIGLIAGVFWLIVGIKELL